MFSKFITKLTAVLFTFAMLNITAPVITKVIPQDLLPIPGVADATCALPYTFHNYIPGGPTQPIDANQLNADLSAAAGCATSNNNDRINLLSYASGSSENTTGSISSGSNRLSLAAAIDFGTAGPCAPQGGGTNCGVVIAGAGPNTTNAQPTGFAVATNCTALTPTVTLTSGGQAVGGVSLMAGLTVGDTVTGTGIPANTTIVNLDIAHQTFTISQAATSTVTESVTIQNACNKSFFYEISTLDTNGGMTQPVLASTSSGPSTLSTWNINCLTWTRPSTGVPAGYVIWKSLDGVNWNFFQIADIEGTGSTCGVGTNGPDWDGGQPNASKPWWIPNTPVGIGSSGLAQYLRTTVQSGGGTTNLTLATNASNTVSSQFVAHDDTPGWLAWEGAVQSAAATGYIPAKTSDGNAVGVRFASSNTFTVSGVHIVMDKGGALLPFGAGFGGSILGFSGGSAVALTGLNSNFQEGSYCLPISTAGRAIGDYINIQQNAPGGPSQSIPYSLTSPIVSLKCSNGPGVQLADPAPITFSAAANIETATITGTLAAGDVLTIQTTGPSAGFCTVNYTVTANDVAGGLNFAGRDLALAVISQCNGGFVSATNTLNVVNLTTPTLQLVSGWAGSATHGGGGTEVVTMAAGVPAAVQLLTPLTNVGVDGVYVLGNDLTGTDTNNMTVILPFDTAGSAFSNNTVVNCDKACTAIFSFYSYGNTYENWYLVAADGGMPNVTSFSDFWIELGTNDFISNVKSINAFSFGPQISASSYEKVIGITQRNAWFGRGIKFGALTKSHMSHISSAGAVFDEFVLCCGDYQNSFDGIEADNAVGVNNGGIDMFDAWDLFNTFTNVRATGNIFDFVSGLSDRFNTIVNGVFGTGSGFASMTVGNPFITFTNTNLCEVAIAPFSAPPTLNTTASCQRAQGTWTPSLTSSTVGTTSYATQLGTWQQNDNLLTTQFNIVTNGALSGFTGVMSITGLPFPIGTSVLGACAITSVKGVTFDAGYTYMTAGVASGETVFLYENGSGVAFTFIPVANFANPVSIYGTCTYHLY